MTMVCGDDTCPASAPAAGIASTAVIVIVADRVVASVITNRIAG